MMSTMAGLLLLSGKVTFGLVGFTLGVRPNRPEPTGNGVNFGYPLFLFRVVTLHVTACPRVAIRFRSKFFAKVEEVIRGGPAKPL